MGGLPYRNQRENLGKSNRGSRTSLEILGVEIWYDLEGRISIYSLRSTWMGAPVPRRPLALPMLKDPLKKRAGGWI